MYILLYFDVNRMANKAIKEIFQTLQRDIITDVSPDSVMDALFSKKVISADDNYRLCHIPIPRDRCRDMLSMLHNSSNPEPFVHLRLMLIDIDKYPWIVERIDEKLSLVVSQVQQKILNKCEDEDDEEKSRDGKLSFLTIGIFIDGSPCPGSCP